LGPLLKALVERLQVALVLLAEVPVALDLVAEHPVVAALMVHQVIVVPELMVLPAGDLAETQALTVETPAMEHPMVTRVMTDHPAMETVELPVVVTVAVMAAVMVVVMAVVTVVVMAAVMVVVTAVVTVVAMAAATAVETNRSYQKEIPPFPPCLRRAARRALGERFDHKNTARNLNEVTLPG
jgi:membrane protein YdbS with pleckstrin-like domain